MRADCDISSLNYRLNHTVVRILCYFVLLSTCILSKMFAFFLHFNYLKNKGD